MNRQVFMIALFGVKGVLDIVVLVALALERRRERSVR